MTPCHRRESSPARPDIRLQLEAERLGHSLPPLHDAEGDQHLITLGPESDSLSLGRNTELRSLSQLGCDPTEHATAALAETELRRAARRVRPVAADNAALVTRA